jgi:hypothetical protein
MLKEGRLRPGWRFDIRLTGVAGLDKMGILLVGNESWLVLKRMLDNVPGYSFISFL